MSRKKAKTQFWESAIMNNATFRQYFNRLTELSISMFEWKNLPDSVDPRFLELTLFRNGQAVFFEDEVMGYLALANASGGPFDVYNTPIYRRAYASNSYQKELDESNSIIIWNNQLRTNSFLDVQMFAKRLYNLDRAIDVNANAQKTPILLICDDTERMTLENIYKEYDGNAPVIKGVKGLNPEALSVLKTDAPFVADKLYALKANIWNEALTYLGISNMTVMKKERLVTDEVARNQGGTIASRYSRLNARKQACTEINKMFELNIDCEYREDFVAEGEAYDDEYQPLLP